MKIIYLLITLLMISCASVEPFEKGFLSDPLMNQKSGAKISLEEKFFSTQEGSAGGTDGVAGGCGCAK